jgi:hypothetical protein
VDARGILEKLLHTFFAATFPSEQNYSDMRMFSLVGFNFPKSDCVRGSWIKKLSVSKGFTL